LIQIVIMSRPLRDSIYFRAKHGRQYRAGAHAYTVDVDLQQRLELVAGISGDQTDPGFRNHHDGVYIPHVSTDLHLITHGSQFRDGIRTKSVFLDAQLIGDPLQVDPGRIHRFADCHTVIHNESVEKVIFLKSIPSAGSKI